MAGTRAAGRARTRARSSHAGRQTVGPGALRAFRGLALVFALSFLSLVSILLIFPFIGGLPDGWTGWRFAGLFGVLEIAAGLSSIILPNIWRLPVAEQRTRSAAKLAPSVVLLPHWGALARVAAGAVLVVAVGVHEGVGLAVILLAPLTVALAVGVAAASLLVARAGVARPDLDVLQLVIHWRNREFELEPFSLGASLLQFVLGIITVPLVHAMPADMLYGDGLAPSPILTGASTVAAFAVGAAAFAAWRDRIDTHAPPDQQEEAAANA